jgi:hypothetical protein
MATAEQANRRPPIQASIAGPQGRPDLRPGEQATHHRRQDRSNDPAPGQGLMHARRTRRLRRQGFSQFARPDLEGALAFSGQPRVIEEGLATELFKFLNDGRRVGRQQVVGDRGGEDAREDRHDQGRDGDPDHGVIAVLFRARMRVLTRKGRGATLSPAAPGQIGEHGEHRQERNNKPDHQAPERTRENQSVLGNPARLGAEPALGWSAD